MLSDWMTKNVWQRVDRRLSNERGKLWLICLLLYILIYLLVWCQNSHHMLKISDISTKWLNSKTWETYVVWRPSCRAVVIRWDLLATASESSSSSSVSSSTQCSRSSAVTSAAWVSENFLDITFFYSFSWIFMG